MLDDLKAAVRSLRSSKTFTAVALIVLALGIGASTAVFSVVDAVVLRGLPFDEHDRLVAVGERRPPGPAADPTTGSRGALERRAPELRRLGRAAADVRVDGRDCRRRLHAPRAGRGARRSPGPTRHRGLLQSSQGAPADGAAVHTGRRSGRPSPRRGAEQWPVATTIRRESGHHREADSARRRQLRSGWRHAVRNSSTRSARCGPRTCGCRTSCPPTSGFEIPTAAASTCQLSRV